MPLSKTARKRCFPLFVLRERSIPRFSCAVWQVNARASSKKSRSIPTISNKAVSVPKKRPMWHQNIGCCLEFNVLGSGFENAPVSRFDAPEPLFQQSAPIGHDGNLKFTLLLSTIDCMVDIRSEWKNCRLKGELFDYLVESRYPE